MKFRVISRKLINYWLKPKEEPGQKIKTGFLTNQPLSRKLAVAALLSALSAAFQSAGALGGIGFAVSALVTLPISIAALLSVYSGLMAYAATLFLLVVFQPAELLIFPFTTGLLGLSIGLSHKFLNRRITIIAFNGLSLTSGIALLLYVFRFPVLGPAVSGPVNLSLILIIYFSCALYSWFWIEISAVVLRILKPALTHRAAPD